MLISWQTTCNDSMPAVGHEESRYQTVPRLNRLNIDNMIN